MKLYSFSSICYPILLLLLGLLLTACNQDDENVVQYLHLSHIKTDTNPNMDEKIEELDLSDYEVLMLGGDLAQSTSTDDATMDYVDGFFNLQAPSTLWSLGNHDYFDFDRINNYTKRAPFYNFIKNDISFLVLDTQAGNCNIIDEQLSFFNTTATQSLDFSYLIILHHKLIWMPDNAVLEPLIPTTSNGELGTCHHCLMTNNFYLDIYPKLVELENSGVEVICIGGDIGNFTKSFEYETDDGVQFLASGISAGSKDNKALLLKRHTLDNTLTWDFVDIDDLK